MTRFPVMDANALLDLLAQLAWADGFLDHREVAVIRQTAASLGLSKKEWHQVVRTHKLQG
jgi:uncharacterized tellurite resistance protein B-like protein